MKTKLHLRSALLIMFMALCMFISTFSINAEETSEAYPDNGIPVVYIDIDESQGTIEDMIASEDHSVYCYGTISIDVPEGFHYADFEEAVCESVSGLSMSIRGRGNSTWVRSQKKPFKVKLDTKTSIFGMAKNKHWALLANDNDPSLIRDRISAWLGDQMGFEFTPRGVPVDLVMRGNEYGEKYLGSYYFTETVRVDKNRLNIDELEEGDTEMPDITGGYLLQVGTQVKEGSPDRFYTKRGLLLATDTPSFDAEANLSDSRNEEDEDEETFAGPDLGDGYVNPVQQEYIQNHINDVEDVIYEEGTAYRELIDVSSAAKYWLFQDFCRNFDAWVTGSTYFYKKRDVDGATGKIFFGPLWDFDFAYDYGYTNTGHIDMFAWMKPMFRDKEEGGFADEIKKQWPSFRQSIIELIKDGGLIDQYYEETKLSAEADQLINHPEITDFDYLQAVTKLKDWIKGRLDWYDADFANTDNLVHKVWFMCDDQELDMKYIMDGKSADTPAEAPKKEGELFLGWYDEEGNNVGSSFTVTKDMVITAEFVPESEATPVEDIALRKDNDIILYSARFNMYQIGYEIVPPDAQDPRFEWVSQDESIASVDQDGLVTVHQPGTVVLSAIMENGNRRDFTLHIIEDGPLPVPESVSPKEETIRMKPGEQLPLYIDTDPSPAKINVYSYVSEDESVVTVDEYGVLRAGNCGQTKVKITATAYGADYYESNDFVTEVTVIVTEEEPEPEPEPVPVSYTVVSDSPASYEKGSKTPVVFTVTRSPEDESCFAHFQDVKLDGVLLKRDSDYTAVSGSTVITLNASMLETLKAGSHEITILFDDGETKAVLDVTEAEPEKKPAPDTSDHTQKGAWQITLPLSLLLFFTAFFFRRRYS